MQSLGRSSNGRNHRSMAVANSLSVLELINRQSQLSQRQIVQATGMQPSTVSNIIRELKEAGIVRESGVLEASGVGAKQISLEIDSSFAWAASWQLDLKGHRLCLLNAAGHTITTENFPRDLGWEAIAAKLPETLSSLAATRRLSMNRFAGLGVCVQGIVNHETGEVIYSHPQKMVAIPLREILQKHLPYPIYVERNIPCGAYQEQHTDIQSRKTSFLYYLLRRHEDFFEHGTGIVLNGEVFRGSHSAAGELGPDFFPHSLAPKDLHDEAMCDTVYEDFGRHVAALADFLDVDGVIVSSDDHGLTEQRFHLLEKRLLATLRPLHGRHMSVTRSQAGPDGMMLGAGLIALHKHFQKAVESLPNRSMAKPKKLRSSS